MSTGGSIYVGASKNLNIALEFACQSPIRLVYKIATKNSICVNEFLSPGGVHREEEEVVFPYQIPLHLIEEVAIAKNWNALATGFIPINDPNEVTDKLKSLGLINQK
jgi:hypothetical protein